MSLEVVWDSGYKIEFQDRFGADFLAALLLFVLVVFFMRCFLCITESAFLMKFMYT